MNDYIESFCQLVFGTLKGQYPDFLVAAWSRQVEIANAIAAGSDNPAHLGLATSMADGVPLPLWAEGVLAKDLEFCQAELALAGFYNTAIAGVAAVEAGQVDLLTSGQQLLAGAQGLVEQITEPDSEPRAIMLAELQSMAAYLQEVAS